MSVVGTAIAASAYCTREDLEARFHAENVTAWVDDDNSGSLDADEIEIIDSAIERASRLIDGRLGAYYSVPFAGTVPTVIRDLAVDLAGHTLFGRKGRDEDTYAEIGRAALKTLEDVRCGRLTLEGVTRLERTIEVTRG